MAFLVLFLLVSSLSASQALTIPDAVNIFNNTIHGKFKMVWIESPEFLPTVDEVHGQDANHRKEFWLEACSYTYLTAVLAGTAIMQIGTRVCACGIKYEKVLSNAGKDAKKARIAVFIVFFCTYAVCLAAVIWSLVTNRLSKDTGLDWEVYWVLLTANCLWLLIQAVVLVTTTHEHYSWSAFLEATLSGTFPILADSFDTLKDAMFGGLCLQSNSSMLKIVGIVSWVYLAFVHVGLFYFDEYVAEFQSCYLSVLYAPSNPKKSNNFDQEPSGQQKALMPVWMVIYKQCTWAKLRVLVIENLMQALGSMVYLICEGGSPLVVLVNLSIPVTQVFFGTIIHHPVARIVKKELLSRLLLAADQGNVMRVRSEATHYIEVEGGKEFYRMMKTRIEENPYLQYALWEGLMCKDSLDLTSYELSDEDVSGLAEALKTNTSLVRLWLGNNNIQDVSALAEALKTNTSLKWLFLSNNKIQDFRALQEALKANATLKTLNLALNNIQEETLRTNGILEYLGLSQNNNQARK